MRHQKEFENCVEGFKPIHRDDAKVNKKDFSIVHVQNVSKFMDQKCDWAEFIELFRNRLNYISKLDALALLMCEVKLMQLCSAIQNIYFVGRKYIKFFQRVNGMTRLKAILIYYLCNFDLIN